MEELAEQISQLQYTLSEHARANNEQFARINERFTTIEKGNTMADMPEVKIHNNPSDPMAAAMMAMSSGRGFNDGLGGGGLLTGVLLASLLRGGGLLGGNTNDVTQPQANMSVMSALGDIKQAVAVSTAQMETSQALQSSTIQAQLSGVAAALTNTTNGVKDAVNSNAVALMQMVNGLQTTVMQGTQTAVAATVADGEKTRALITSQYEATLNRQLSDANAAIIELRSQQTAQAAARSAEINVTQNVNQLQQQQQQQAQFERLTGVLLDVAQNIRATNQAINIGAGTLTANPMNTNTNVRT
jgi:hypothetical protein